MPDRSAIEWTDATWNPTTGCTRVSAGCDHCYAATLASRLLAKTYRSRLPVVDTPANRRDPFAVRLWPDRLRIPASWRKPRRVFVNSMSDLFHRNVPEAFVRRCFQAMLDVDRHIYQVLTKRPARAAKFVERHWDLLPTGLPAHIWIGTSVEDQSVDYRVRHLLAIPAAVRFLSCEPLIGPLDLGAFVNGSGGGHGLHWVIVGGESGIGARPMQAAWARKLRDQCRGAEVPFFFKQWGGRTPKAGGRELDGVAWDEYPGLNGVSTSKENGMAAPRETVWQREAHTEGKHLVLKRYLDAWFPILGMGDRNGRILFVDGFAGPGEYRGGEEGSPVVAMRALAEHSARTLINAEVVFLFIEKDAARLEHLKGRVARWRPRLPEHADVRVWPGTFESRMEEVLDKLAEQNARMAPALVMLDPFGVKGIPMATIRRILANPKCEVYITFMWENMNRFLSGSEFESHLDQLFGTPKWREAKDMAGDDREEFLHDLYRQQLKKAGAEHVVYFPLFSRNRHKYSIFFGTQHTLGSDRMKKAIWRVAPLGGFEFRGGEKDQMSFLAPVFGPLQDALRKRFDGEGWVSIDDIADFVRSDKTIYHEGQLRSQALKPMEKQGRIHVDRHAGARSPDFPRGKCRINFRPQRLSLFESDDL